MIPSLPILSFSPTIVDSAEEKKQLKAMPKAAFYAVKVGRTPGVYDTWAETLAQVDGYAGAKHKKFKSRAEAESFLDPSLGHPAISTNPLSGSSGASSSSTSGSSRTTTSASTSTSSARNRADSPISSIRIRDLPADLRAIAEKGYTFSRSSSDPKGKARLVAYCDGSGLGNGQVGATAGAGVWWGAKGEAWNRRISERVPGEVQTNNRGELLAVILALEQCPYPHLPLEIRTDSQYTIQCMTTWLPKWLSTNVRLSSKGKSGTKSKSKGINANGHGEGSKDVKNADLIKHLLVLFRRRSGGSSIRFKYVPAHTGVEGNEAADRLAKLGAVKPALPDRLHWLDPEVDDDPPSAPGGSVNVDVEIGPEVLMTLEDIAAFDIIPGEEF